MANTYEPPIWRSLWYYYVHIRDDALACNDVQMLEVVRSALCEGRLRARRNGQELKPTDWKSNPKLNLFEGVEFHRSNVAKWLKQYEPAIISDSKRRGPKASYDWDACWAFICRYVAKNGGLLPPKQTVLIEAIEQWFAEKYGQDPKGTAIQERVSLLYREFGLGGN